MRASAIIFLPFLATTAVAQTLLFYTTSDCSGGSERTYDFRCGQDCTNLDNNFDISVMIGTLEPNQQVVFYTDQDCKGDPYTAAGDAFGSAVGVQTCISSICNGFGSFKTNIYDTHGGGEACPPGSLTVAPTRYPKPTEGGCE